MTDLPDVPEDEENEIIQGWDTAPVAGDRVDVHMGPIVAGDPDGARVEVTGDGLHAYDETGTETAHIKGEGGEFVGGSFRTSDHLPGQVTLSNTALQNPYSGISEPGIRVEPINSSGYARLPGVGPSDDNMLISGGARAKREPHQCSPVPSLCRDAMAPGRRLGIHQHLPRCRLLASARGKR